MLTEPTLYLVKGPRGSPCWSVLTVLAPEPGSRHVDKHHRCLPVLMPTRTTQHMRMESPQRPIHPLSFVSCLSISISLSLPSPPSPPVSPSFGCPISRRSLTAASLVLVGSSQWSSFPTSRLLSTAPSRTGLPGKRGPGLWQRQRWVCTLAFPPGGQELAFGSDASCRAASRRVEHQEPSGADSTHERMAENLNVALV